MRFIRTTDGHWLNINLVHVFGLELSARSCCVKADGVTIKEFAFQNLSEGEELARIEAQNWLDSVVRKINNLSLEDAK